MQTNTGGGIWKGIKRKLSGENFLISEFKNRGIDKSFVGVGSYYPGKIQVIDLPNVNGTYYCQQRAFLCSTTDVDVSISFTRRFGAGFFGGEGFILQKLTGDGTVFVQAGGTIVKKVLGFNESIKIDTGCLLGFSAGIDYDITMVSGIMNPIFGGDGLFLAHLKGPGEVMIQSLPFARLANNIYGAITDFSGKGGRSDDK